MHSHPAMRIAHAPHSLLNFAGQIPTLRSHEIRHLQRNFSRLET